MLNMIDLFQNHIQTSVQLEISLANRYLVVVYKRKLKKVTLIKTNKKFKNNKKVGALLLRGTHRMGFASDIIIKDIITPIGMISSLTSLPPYLCFALSLSFIIIFQYRIFIHIDFDASSPPYLPMYQSIPMHYSYILLI